MAIYNKETKPSLPRSSMGTTDCRPRAGPDPVTIPGTLMDGVIFLLLRGVSWSHTKMGLVSDGLEKNY